MLNAARQKFNKALGRTELSYKIYCGNCKKHMYDSDFEMEPKLCLVCSGDYARLLTRAGIANNDIARLLHKKTGLIYENK